jgi:hypothetical protein
MFTCPESPLWFTHTSDAENLLRPLFAWKKYVGRWNAA